MATKLSLKEIYKKILMERTFADYDEYKVSRNFNGSDRRAIRLIADNVASLQNLDKIYELEYKLFALAKFKKSKGDWLEDADNMRFMRLGQTWTSNLEELITDMLERTHNVFVGWITMEESSYIIPEKYPNSDEFYYDRELSFYADVEKEFINRYGVPSGARIDNYFDPPQDPEDLKVFTEIEVELRKKFSEEIQSQDPYKSVMWIINKLEGRNAIKDVRQLVVMFHMALNTAHNNGSMATVLFGGVGGSQNTSMGKAIIAHLDALSNGKFIPKWDQELKRDFIPVDDGSQKESINEDAGSGGHPSPQEVIQAVQILLS